MGILIEETKVVTVKDKNGTILQKGDPCLLRIKEQDVVCRFMGMDNGYFTTQSLSAGNEVRYRQGSIESCVRISGIRSWPEERLVTTAENAAQYADAPVLAPGA